MPASSSSSVQAARQALVDRLRELCRDAGLEGKQLAAACGWHPSKVSRTATAKASPSADDIRAYSPNFVPGLIQTYGYTEDVLRAAQRRRVEIDDVADAVAARMERQRVLYEGHRRFRVPGRTNLGFGISSEPCSPRRWWVDPRECG
ncbi:Scr1 family TA system antitoxin-like transcriptional regulator [Streptomyces sp. NPDC002643]